MTNNYKGMSLFNDVEDVALRNYNRGQVLANIAVDGRTGNRISISATKDLIGYFKAIPEEERKPVMEEFVVAVKEAGFILTGA